MSVWALPCVLQKRGGGGGGKAGIHCILDSGLELLKAGRAGTHFSHHFGFYLVQRALKKLKAAVGT